LKELHVTPSDDGHLEIIDGRLNLIKWKIQPLHDGELLRNGGYRKIICLNNKTLVGFIYKYARVR